MVSLEKAGMDEIYKYIVDNGSLEQSLAARAPVSLPKLSFVDFDAATKKRFLPGIEQMNDVTRQKARFMLDVCVLRLARKGKTALSPGKIAIDMHFSTLAKTGFRSRYLGVLADLLNNFDHPLVLNIKNVPEEMHPTRISDLLRYLIPVPAEVTVAVSQNNILTQDLTRIASKYFVVDVAELSRINASGRRKMTMERLAHLPSQNKHVVVRNIDIEAAASEQAAPQVQTEAGRQAFYL